MLFLDVALVTSLRDGMNLVSYEFVACQESKKGVLILSEVSIVILYLSWAQIYTVFMHMYYKLYDCESGQSENWRCNYNLIYIIILMHTYHVFLNNHFEVLIDNKYSCHAACY